MRHRRPSPRHRPGRPARADSNRRAIISILSVLALGAIAAGMYAYAASRGAAPMQSDASVATAVVEQLLTDWRDGHEPDTRHRIGKDRIYNVRGWTVRSAEVTGPTARVLVSVDSATDVGTAITMRWRFDLARGSDDYWRLRDFTAAP